MKKLKWMLLPLIIVLIIIVLFIVIIPMPDFVIVSQRPYEGLALGMHGGLKLDGKVLGKLDAQSTEILDIQKKLANMDINLLPLSEYKGFDIRIKGRVTIPDDYSVQGNRPIMSGYVFRDGDQLYVHDSGILVPQKWYTARLNNLKYYAWRIKHPGQVTPNLILSTEKQ